MKKLVAAILCIILAFPVSAFAVADERIFTDAPSNIFVGRSDSSYLIQNLDFRDVPGDHWAKEAIVRSGALNMVKGYDLTYSPGAYVTNQEALAFVIRLMNLESQAIDEAVRVRNNMAIDETTRNMWSIGYISLARSLGIITAAQYAQLTAGAGASTAGAPTTGAPTGLVATDPVSRQQAAYWLATSLNTMNPNAIDMTSNVQSALLFSDWDNIDIAFLKSVDALSKAGIMQGSSGRFNPASGLTRAEMAQILRNMDTIYYNINNIQKISGTVGGIRDNQERQTGSALGWRNIYVRTGNGGVDIIQYQVAQSNPALQYSEADTVVYKNGKVTSSMALEEGDKIEYLIDAITYEVLYIQVLSTGTVEKTVEGKLYGVDVITGKITLQDNAGKSFVYSMMQGIYDVDYITIDQANAPIKTLPLGSTVTLKLRNDTVEAITFVGTPVLIDEMRGIVTENNTEFGYLTFVDNKGAFITKNYYADSIKVEKQQYYNMDDEIGYLDEVFPNFKYDPRDTVIEDIEPGDIVFMRFDKDDGNVISNISASTNYVAKYGKIKQITYSEGLSRFLVEYEDKQTNWFDVANTVFASKDGKPIAQSKIMAGDWAKFLVNQAIIQPGYIVESVKEINIEGNEHFISSIIKGQLAGIEPIQKQLMVQNAQTLEKTGWSNYQNLQNVSIAGNDIEYYYNDQRISLDYAQKFLKRAEGDVYIALENSPSGERAKMVTFRNGRDELLNADTIITADGNGGFAMLSNSGTINTDVGTIVRRHGRLVDGNSIIASDYTTVSLNDGNTAAVVDIVDTPDVTNVMIARGRILSVDEGKSFKVQSMSVLSGNNWVYTPVQREFTIDYSTLFINESGLVDQKTFIDYTEDSVYDKVFNIVYEGSKAVRIVDSGYAKMAVRGTIYQADSEKLNIKDAQYYENTTGKWLPLSLKNPSMTITIPLNTIVAKNNQVVSANKLVVGDRVRVLTDVLPDEMIAGVDVTGYMIFVEK